MDIAKLMAMLELGGAGIPSELQSVVRALQAGDYMAIVHELPKLTPILIETMRSVAPMLGHETRAKLIAILEG